MADLGPYMVASCKDYNYVQKYDQAEIHDNLENEFCKNTNMKTWSIHSYKCQCNNISKPYE